VDLSPQPLAFVSFSERLSKTELRAVKQTAIQPVLPGFEPIPLPEPKYRIDESCSRGGFPFLPRHKSAESSTFGRARIDGGAVDGEIAMEIDGTGWVFHASVIFAPMRVGGELTDRFLAMIRLG
jgi:hypothetical protein